MKVIGLTGGIATGKSSVASLLREFGAKIVDADQIAREIVRPGQSAWQGIVDAFGPQILKADKTIDRDKLRKIIFKDNEARRILETITHPQIRRLAQEKIKKLASEGAGITVYEAPLLYENSVHLWVGPVILVACDLETQKTRLRERDGLSVKEIEQHLKAQMPLEAKRQLADIIIENIGDLEDLRKQVKEVWEKITTISHAPGTSPPTGPRGPDPQSE